MLWQFPLPKRHAEPINHAKMLLLLVSTMVDDQL